MLIAASRLAHALEMEKQAGIIGKGLGFAYKQIAKPLVQGIGSRMGKNISEHGVIGGMGKSLSSAVPVAGGATMLAAPVAALNPGQATQQLAGALV